MVNIYMQKREYTNIYLLTKGLKYQARKSLNKRNETSCDRKWHTRAFSFSQRKERERVNERKRDREKKREEKLR